MTDRREFIGWLGATSLLSGVALPLSAEAPESSLAEDQQQQQTFDMSWFDKLKGKQVGVFDCPKIADGEGLFRAVTWRKQYIQVYPAASETVTPVLVIRAEAISMVMNDEFWARFAVGAANQVNDPATRAAATRNVYASPSNGGRGASDSNIASFISAGGIVLACNLAFGGCVRKIQQGDSLSQPEAYAKTKEMLVPGVVLQPSGFFAVMKAQETGGGYMMAV